MNQPTSITRRLACRLTEHAGRVLPEHRSGWANAMQNELDHVPDHAALRWAAGAVFASYVERIRSFNPAGAIHLMRSFLLSCALVVGSVLTIEVSHILSQFLLQDDAMRLLQERLPASVLTTAAGSYAPLAIILTFAISTPLAAIATILGSSMVRWAPSRARTAIRATIVMDAAFVAGAILINYLLLPEAPFDPLTVLLWLIRVLFVAAPLLILLRVYRDRPDAAVITR